MESLILIVLLILGLLLFLWLAPKLHHEGDEPEDEQRSSAEEGAFEPPEPIELPIDGSLDLHTFSPKDVGRLVPEWLELCRRKGFTEVRIIHGKGKGVLRRQVHKILDRHPGIEGYELAGPGRGSWGATIVRLSRRA